MCSFSAQQQLLMNFEGSHSVCRSRSVLQRPHASLNEREDVAEGEGIES